MNKLLNVIDTLMPVITLLLSFVVSKHTAKCEAKKLLMEKNELKKLKTDSLFLKLLSLSQQYCEHHFGATKTECLDTAVALMQIAPKDFISLVTEMYTAVETQNYNKITELRKKLLDFYLQTYKNTNQNSV